MRRLGSFLPGDVVGGSGVHWSGHTWRWTDMEFKVRSMYEERYGKNFIPADMTIQDWGITYAELEPYYDKFEHTAAISGKAGNMHGQIQAGGNPFEAPRAREYPLPPLTTILASEMFAAAAKNNGYHPFPRPTANASRAYTNPDGSKFGACQYCGYCQRFGCEANAKGSAHMTVIPIAMRNPNFELRTNSWVTKVLKDSDGKHVTGVTYTNVLNGEEFEQPASMVLIVRLCDQQRAHDAALGHRPALRSGRTERRHRQELLLPDRRRREPVLRGSALQSVHEPRAAQTSPSTTTTPTGVSIAARTVSSAATTLVAASTRRCRSAIGRCRAARRNGARPGRLATAKWYQTAMNIGASGSVMANRYNYFDLDPTYPQCVRPAVDAHDL